MVVLQADTSSGVLGETRGAPEIRPGGKGHDPRAPREDVGTGRGQLRGRFPRCDAGCRRCNEQQSDDDGREPASTWSHRALPRMCVANRWPWLIGDATETTGHASVTNAASGKARV